MTTPNQQKINSQLSQLQKLVGCDDMDVRVVDNLPHYRTIWQLHGKNSTQGQLEARFGSEYADEPDGFAAYVEGYNWTDYLSTIEECAKQLKDRKHTYD